METRAGNVQGAELVGKCREVNEEQRRVCLKLGKGRKMKEAAQVLWDTDCLSKERWSNHNCRPGTSLPSPIPLTKLSLSPRRDDAR